MRVDFTKLILDLDDKPIAMERPANLPADAPTPVMTLGDLAQTALQGFYKDKEPNVSGAEKTDRTHLCLAIRKHPECVEMKAEQIATLKTLLNMCYPSPLIYTRASELLEGDAILGEVAPA